MVKSQILRGGRGKGRFASGLQGGIQTAGSADEAASLASRMLGQRLATKQTADAGLTVSKVYVAESVQYDDEWYLAMTIDRENYSPAIVLSKSGGVDIESVAAESPEKLFTFHFGISTGITPDLVASIAQKLNISPAEARNLQSTLQGLYRIFTEKDATLLEINPLAKSGEVFQALDAKFTFDNAAKRRQKELFSAQDPAHEVVEEAEADKYGLVYVRMEGNIGNVVNGAGLAMATNDAISLYGGSSANFLDAGGQATKETMQQAFRIILNDERVKAILVNIYGGEHDIFPRAGARLFTDLTQGIIRCDMIAESIIAAASALGPMRVPVVVRLQGTNSQQGLKLVSRPCLGPRCLPLTHP